MVHQIRNACKYVVWKDRKEFPKDMKDIYGAPNRQADALDDLDKKWSSKYSYLSKVGGQTGMNLPSSLTFLLKLEKLFTLQI